MFTPNRVAFALGPLTVNWYGVLIAAAVLIGYLLAAREQKRLGLPEGTMLDIFFYIVPLAIICARIYYVAFSWDMFRDRPWEIVMIHKGGIAIYGAVLGGILGAYIFSRRRHVPMGKLIDMLTPSLVLGQAIGRWGNFFNQEAYGPLVTETSKQFFPYAVYIERLGEWHMATFFYESVVCLAIFVFLLIYRAKAKKAPDGNLFLWYWVLYGIERFFVEGLRQDSLWMFKGGLPIGNLIFFPNGLRVSQALSLVMVIAFSIVLLVRFIKRRKAAAAQPAQLDPELVLVNDAQADGADEASAADAENAAQEVAETETEAPAQEPEQAPEEDGGDAIEPDEDKKEDGEQN